MDTQAAFTQCANQLVGTAAFQAGSKVWWKYAACKAFKPKNIAAVVLWQGKTRARIEFAQWIREEWVREIRTISVSNLSNRDETSLGIDQFHPDSSEALAA